MGALLFGLLRKPKLLGALEGRSCVGLLFGPTWGAESIEPGSRPHRSRFGGAPEALEHPPP
jgi:hypothetical protein